MSIRKRRLTGKLVVLNEEELIRQVHLRPLLYDRSLKSFRKTSLRKQYWQEISNNMDASVEECRRRWRSLRDAFSKHYKMVQRTDDEHLRRKHSKWVFYDQMSFLTPYLDSASYELDDNLIEEFGDNSDDGQSVRCESTALNVDSQPPQEAEVTKLSSSLVDHNQRDDNVQQSTVSVQATDFMPVQEESIVMESHHQHQQPHDNGHPAEQMEFRRKDTQFNNTALSFQTDFDSDEKFLLSCVPTLRRLTHRQNSMARLQIQQILFDIEFGDRRAN